MLLLTEQVDDHVQRNRERGLVLLGTLPGCPACAAGNQAWDRIVAQCQGRRALARELGTVSDFDPVFSKALFPAVAVHARRLKAFGVPPVLFFGPGGLEYAAQLDDFSTGLERLREAVRAHSDSQQGLGFDPAWLLRTLRFDLRSGRRRFL